MPQLGLSSILKGNESLLCAVAKQRHIGAATLADPAGIAWNDEIITYKCGMFEEMFVAATDAHVVWFLNLSSDIFRCSFSPSFGV